MLSKYYDQRTEYPIHRKHHMAKIDPKKRVKTLVDLIDRYDEAYYNENQQLVTDQEYDGLKDELRKLAKTTKLAKALANQVQDALTRVGAPLPSDGKWPKIQHEVPMGSLDKVNLPSELQKWFEDCGSPAGGLFISEKLDGISIDLKYENGVFVRGTTRGDGETGQDITRNVKKMKGVPDKTKEKFTGHVRSEIVLFHSVQKKQFPDMEAVRNAAGGKAVSMHGGGQEHLNVLSYTIEGKDFDTEVEAIKYIKKLGFDTSGWRMISHSDDPVRHTVQRWQQYMDHDRAQLDYAIDGLVVRINDRAAQFALGETSSGRPVGATAFKFEAPEARTTITDIPVQVGNTGQLTPVAEFDTVNLLNTNVSRASLHNFGIIKSLGIDIGATVMVKKAGDVIPQVESVVKGTGTVFKAPKKCPACGSHVVWRGDMLYCPNSADCEPQRKGRLAAWIKEHGILGWGDSLLDQVMHLCSDVDGLYELTPQEMAVLPRMSEKNATKLLKELHKFFEVPLENFIGGLCIDGIGTGTVKQVMKAGYDELDDLLNLSVADLEDIQGFGHTKAELFHYGIQGAAHRIEALLEAGVKVKSIVKGSLTGKSFCFTGTLAQPRAALQQIVKDSGGDVKKRVGKDLDFLVIPDLSWTSSKTKAARKLGTKLLSEQDFMKMAGA
jgi:DNA ligase (NAD+)